MVELKLKVIVTGDLSNNCYLVCDNAGKKCFLVDCASPSLPIKDFLKNNQLELAFIALTHAHFDHIGGLSDFDVPFYVHQEDREYLKEAKLNGSAFFSSSLTVERQPLFYGSEPLTFQGHSIEVIPTPGHTPGSVSLKIDNWLFSGDALFYRSIGITDIPRASGPLLLDSIKEKLFVLPDETLVYPGHGPSTSVGQEKAHNPFFS
jgi:hydroxyacylglutathione hydrolase